MIRYVPGIGGGFFVLDSGGGGVSTNGDIGLQRRKTRQRSNMRRYARMEI
jgi:hypothetical protein